MTVADRIKSRREQIGLSQMELAKRMGLKNKTSICKMEQAGDHLSLKTVSKVAEALMCSETYLLGFEDDAPTMEMKVETNTNIDYLITICKKLSSDDIQTLTDMAKVFESRRK